MIDCSKIIASIEEIIPPSNFHIQPFGDPDEGCWIQITSKEFPFVSVGVCREHGQTSFDIASSFFSGGGGCRWNPCARINSQEELLNKFREMVAYYNELVARARK